MSGDENAITGKDPIGFGSLEPFGSAPDVATGVRHRDDERTTLVFDDVPNGLFLAAALSQVDVDDLPGDERLEVLRGWARLVAHAQGKLFEAMASIVDAVVDEDEYDPERPMEMVEAAEAAAVEIAVALHLTRRAADRDLRLALDLRRRLPRVLAALENGDIDRRRAGVLLHETNHLSVAEARQVVGTLIDDAPHWTAGQLRVRVRRACVEVDPDEAQRRYEQALTERQVTLQPTDAGTAVLRGQDLPADRAEAARNRIESIARSLVGPDEARTLDQLRADVYLDLLLGAHPGESPLSASSGERALPTIDGAIHLTVDLATLAGLTEDAGELAGYGPIVADLARQIALEHTAGSWTFSVADPDGRTVATGITRRRPTSAVARAVRARRPTCAFPGCRRPAVDCDLDHRKPWSKGGRTCRGNLTPLCRYHHVHHHRGWKYEFLPHGKVRWTSPLGRVTIVAADRTSRPPPRR